MTIFIDMDDVLANTYKRHIELYNEEFKTNLHIADLTAGEVWENVPAEHKQSILDHCFKPDFFSSLEPMKDSIQVVEALVDQYEVYVASAAMEFPLSLKEKSDWLDKYFPFISWKYRIMCGNKFILNGDLLIDDRAYNLKNFKGDTMLFSSPHNVGEKDYTRMHSWQEIASKLL
ncbi:hypothetical protein KH5_18360 [Urechidicola sp. KH5]